MALLDYALTTVQRAADYLGLGTIASGSTKETNLQLIINSVTTFLERYTGRRMLQTTYTQEEYDVDDNATGIVLKHNPVDESTGVTLEVRTSSLNEDDWDSIDAEDYFVDYNAGIIKPASGLTFVGGIKKYRVTYKAGYNFDNSSTYLGDTDAADFEYVAMKLIAAAWDKRKTGAGVKSETLYNYSVTYMDTIFESPEIKEIVDKYKRMDGPMSYSTPKHY